MPESPKVSEEMNKPFVASALEHIQSNLSLSEHGVVHNFCLIHRGQYLKNYWKYIHLTINIVLKQMNVAVLFV